LIAVRFATIGAIRAKPPPFLPACWLPASATLRAF
jgi:hypothetical protein